MLGLAALRLVLSLEQAGFVVDVARALTAQALLSVVLRQVVEDEGGWAGEVDEGMCWVQLLTCRQESDHGLHRVEAAVKAD